MAKQEQYIATGYVPNNYQSGVNVLGKTFKVFNLVEAGILGIGSFLLTYFILKKFSVSTETMLATSICMCAPFILLGLNGIDNESLHEYISHIIMHFKNRRIVKYNPKVKKNIKRIDLEGIGGQTELLPKEKIMMIYEKYKKQLDDNSRAKMLEQEKLAQENGVEYIFDDDEEMLEKYNLLPKKKKGKEENVEEEN